MVEESTSRTCPPTNADPTRAADTAARRPLHPRGSPASVVSRRGRARQPLLEERPHQSRDRVAFLLEGELAGVEEVELDVLEVPPIRVGALGGEDLVVLAPDDERRRLMAAEVGLPPWVERRVRTVAVEELQLDLLVAGPIQQVLVDEPVVGA